MWEQKAESVRDGKIIHSPFKYGSHFACRTPAKISRGSYDTLSKKSQRCSDPTIVYEYLHPSSKVVIHFFNILETTNPSELKKRSPTFADSTVAPKRTTEFDGHNARRTTIVLGTGIQTIPSTKPFDRFARASQEGFSKPFPFPFILAWEGVERLVFLCA